MSNDKSNKTSNLNSTEKAQLELDDFLEAISSPGVISSLSFELEQNLKLEAEKEAKKIAPKKTAVKMAS